ncbi:MAG: hypothetical protein IPG08_05075 [Sphingobacteriaceae bacterium]|nr:hypothetical protein [Sphingobacteriaceae bacterium]
MKPNALIVNELLKRKIKHAKQEDLIINEVHKILNNDLFHEKKVLAHLQLYNRSFELMNEDDADILAIFSLADIKEICIAYRLRFIDSQNYKKEIPYEAILKIKDLNTKHRKDLKGFKILAPIENFRTDGKDEELLLFAQTDHGNYYLIHKWGSGLSKHRKFFNWPMRRFETLVFTVVLVSAILAVTLPTRLIWLPEGADYWGMYRVGAFFHILIFNMGITTYLTFAFSNNLSVSSWNSTNDFR